MIVEFETLVRNNTRTLVPKPLNRKPITIRWLYKVKLKSNSSLDKYKLRFIARCFKQQYDIDYYEKFFLVVKSQTSCVVLTLELTSG